MGGGKPDTYVQVYLLPGTHKELKTKVVKNNSNPVFQETMKFQVPQDKVQDKTIVLQVMDKDLLSKDDKIGEVQIPLNRVDLSRKIQVWREIGPASDIRSAKSPSKSRGSSSEDERRTPKRSASTGVSMINYKIRYEHSSRNLVIGVLAAKNLKNADLIGKAPDAYTQVILYQGHKLVKTKTVKNNVNPVWNEEFRFEIGLDKVSSYNLILRLFDDDVISKDDPLGEVVIPMWQVDFTSGIEEWKSLQAVSKVKSEKILIFLVDLIFTVTFKAS